MSLAASLLEGNRLALARLLTQVENNSEEGNRALDELFPYTGKAHLVGVTGAPGTGKSSLVNQLVLHARKDASSGTPPRVAVVAVDPSSPFTGGAILGDRVRMRDLAGDPGVFIRSMASRGRLGGLALATSNFVQVLDAAGFELVFIETVGAGQAEVDIARLAHTTLVIEAPGLGDEIQAIKAGILEVADILVVNKADRPGAENTERALRGMLELGHPSARWSGHHAGSLVVKEEKNTWSLPIVRTVATEGKGVEELSSAIQQHRLYLQQSGTFTQRERLRLQAELEAMVQADLVRRWQAKLPPQEYQEVLERLVQRQVSPQQAVRELTRFCD
jgi:LAO/AO transport system kinase